MWPLLALVECRHLPTSFGTTGPEWFFTDCRHFEHFLGVVSCSTYPHHQPLLLLLCEISDFRKVYWSPRSVCLSVCYFAKSSVLQSILVTAVCLSVCSRFTDHNSWPIILIFWQLMYSGSRTIQVFFWSDPPFWRTTWRFGAKENIWFFTFLKSSIFNRFCSKLLGHMLCSIRFHCNENPHYEACGVFPYFNVFYDVTWTSHNESSDPPFDVQRHVFTSHEKKSSSNRQGQRSNSRLRSNKVQMSMSYGNCHYF